MNAGLRVVAVSGLSYVVIFSIPWAREQFMLDPMNVQQTASALAIGISGAAPIEAGWWVRGRMLGERRTLWRTE
jgi:cation-transporting ATPase E